ncbi:hypothetical protein FB45DRAFT_927410 [Roridomyces roridus]|uniref:Uncharacterized protein n=1 Tax=Roridomyces roridus TaxID=1738132 RepID=A0AAD7BJ51_9AGAR|nr:hypothetical protein FB45DRAFT_927410 [Roridomyces roridus]
MLDLGCTVFDFSYWAKRRRTPDMPAALYRINAQASILNCAGEWISDLITLAEANSNILGVSFHGYRDPESYTRLSTVLSQNRRTWAANTPIPEGEDAVFWFGFPSEARAQGACISIPFSSEPQDTSILLFKTAEAGIFRVTLQNATTLEAAGPGRVAWALDGAELTFSNAIGLSPLDSEGPEYTHASFTVEVASPGVHQLDISFKTWNSTTESGGPCALRRIWISRDGSHSFVDEWIREGGRPISPGPRRYVPPGNEEFQEQESSSGS